MSPPELLDALNRDLVACRRCPRLVEWREAAGRAPRRAYAGEEYWARPVPNFGDPAAGRLIVGLAPAAHGANRTGRMFTGDRSGEFLFAALHRAGVASAAASTRADDGLRLRGVLISAAVHCAPPGNQPLPDEFAACGAYLDRLLSARPWRAILCLGGIAWRETWRALRRGGAANVGAPKFGHGASARLGELLVCASYHPSQQNTFTGTLTPAMLDAALATFLAG